VTIKEEDETSVEAEDRKDDKVEEGEEVNSSEQ
jgi:hypothetical protein